MNHVNEKDAPQQRQVEEMDTQEGNYIMSSIAMSVTHRRVVGHGDCTISMCDVISRTVIVMFELLN